jgi:2-methylisocitrate lyase-like PEP mutase family enzyme
VFGRVVYDLKKSPIGGRSSHGLKKNTLSAAEKLRALLAKPEMILVAACFEALSARLVEQAGLAATFVSGFGVAATRLGAPDTGLISYGEMVDQGRSISGGTPERRRSAYLLP